jgi:hypothetical protein
MKNELEWRTIYYHEELDIDGSLIHVEWVEEASYKHGLLIRSIFDQTYKEHMLQVRNESITFVPSI